MGGGWVAGVVGTRAVETHVSGVLPRRPCTPLPFNFCLTALAPHKRAYAKIEGHAFSVFLAISVSPFHFFFFLTKAAHTIGN